METNCTGDSSKQLFPTRDNCIYTPSYCEENVWCFCDHIRQQGNVEDLQASYAVFISNDKKAVPLWKQTLGSSNQPVVWDYHVIFMHERLGNTCLFDFDTTLPFPCQFAQYANLAIKSNDDLRPEYHRFFRVVPARLFLQQFASDRTHMLDDDGKFKAVPPAYPCIQTTESTNNLASFISMDSGRGFGTVLGYQSLIKRFSGDS